MYRTLRSVSRTAAMSCGPNTGLPTGPATRGPTARLEKFESTYRTNASRPRPATGITRREQQPRNNHKDPAATNKTRPPHLKVLNNTAFNHSPHNIITHSTSLVI